MPDDRGFTLYLQQGVTPEQTRGAVQVLKVTLIDVREGSEQLGLFPLVQNEGVDSPSAREGLSTPVILNLHN